jgi:shikimate dehydrogenase
LKTYGLIGYPLSHSFSEKYFASKFKDENIPDCEYKLFPLNNISELDFLIKSTPALEGLNVTIPYKKTVITYLNEMDPVAKKIGAVNTIKISRDKKHIYLKGYNTDAWAFEESIKPLIMPHHNAALILGAGGAAKAVEKSLVYGFGIDHIMFVTRKPENFSTLGYSSLDQKVFDYYKLIINTTPVGMYPDISTYPPIPYEYLTPEHLLFDLVYNPSETVFLKKGKEKGAQVKNGLEMLYLQANKAWEIWNER